MLCSNTFTTKTGSSKSSKSCPFGATSLMRLEFYFKSSAYWQRAAVPWEPSPKILSTLILLTGSSWCLHVNGDSCSISSLSFSEQALPSLCTYLSSTEISRRRKFWEPTERVSLSSSEFLSWLISFSLLGGLSVIDSILLSHGPLRSPSGNSLLLIN